LGTDKFTHHLSELDASQVISISTAPVFSSSNRISLPIPFAEPDLSERVLPCAIRMRRMTGPVLEGRVKCADLGEAQQESDFADAKPTFHQVPQREFAATSADVTSRGCGFNFTAAASNHVARGTLLGIMPQFVIEREIPGAGSLSDTQLREISLRSLETLEEMGPQIQWLHSYVTENKVYCVYLAPDENSIREHARRVGIPADRVSAVRRLIDPVNLK
jgi:Nickel responsive protein SCO4226-like